MAYVLGNIPFFGCYVRREFTRNMKDRHGEFIPAVAYAVRCVRAHSLWFQCMLMEPADADQPNNTGGASFLLPIQALCDEPCEYPKDMTYVQPWDCMSNTFGVVEMDFVKRGMVYILPDRLKATYLFTIDFTESDLADTVEQHKSAHICKLANGLIGAFPNNRLIWRDDAFWKMMTEQPDFVSLAPEFRSESHPIAEVSIEEPKIPRVIAA